MITAIFEFPGFSKDEVQVDFQNGKLTVSAETKKSEDHADAGYTLRERLHVLAYPSAPSRRTGMLFILNFAFE